MIDEFLDKSKILNRDKLVTPRRWHETCFEKIFKNSPLGIEIASQLSCQLYFGTKTANLSSFRLFTSKNYYQISK